MRGHGVLRHVEPAGDFARGHSVRFVAHQQPEHVEPCALSERAKRNDSRIIIHKSGIADMSGSNSTNFRHAGFLETADRFQ